MVRIDSTDDQLWNRMNRAVEKIQERLVKTAATLEAAQIPYAKPSTPSKLSPWMHSLG